jgi:sugar fermentation stimulation protein A
MEQTGEFQDRGSSIVILRLGEARRISVGELGSLLFKRGYSLYVGSAKRGLVKRVARYERKAKKRFWHIDSLRSYAAFQKTILARTSEDLEGEIASKPKDLADWTIPGFGCSDCRCPTHAFATESNPRLHPSLMKTISESRHRKTQTAPPRSDRV